MELNFLTALGSHIAQISQSRSSNSTAITALTATETAPCGTRIRYSASDALCIELLDINIQEPRCLERIISELDTLHKFKKKPRNMQILGVLVNLTSSCTFRIGLQKGHAL